MNNSNAKEEVIAPLKSSGVLDQAVDFISNLSWAQTFLLLIVAGLIYDQVSYIRKKGSIAGPRFKMWPVIGPFLESMNPKFTEYEAKWRSGPLSCVSVFHKFVVIASTRDLARKVLNSPAYARPCVVDVAIKLLRPSNWVFKDGKEHLEYRKALNPLFTKQAIAYYFPAMEECYHKYLEEFVASSEKYGAKEYMTEFREINCANSLRVFCGRYISDDQVKSVSDNYYKVTAALELVNFPIILPFTKPWYGKKICDMTMTIIAGCAQLSKDHVAAGGEITCVMDAWCKTMYDGKSRTFSNKEISETIFTFLFASQDATSSATTWLFQIIGDRPEVMLKIREEQLRVRGGNPNVPLTVDLVDKMEYTHMVVKEALRYRPPVSMVPYVCKTDFPITPEYTAPKGAMVIPTLHPALHDPEVYDNPEEFIPERWVAGSKARKALNNWLVFGSGPHICLGQKYVMLHLTALMGKACMLYDWKHTITPTSEVIRVFATIFPEDDCILEFRKRTPDEVLDVPSLD
ncbi:C-22 sterol desaturase [Starmerella bacillaris]|uniref:C-22 sterol desaturase ERG5 n=1 Tax=Starmerella bacillaris TaxID=1247836 RepID=A0AAV5RPN3_STABA|nr:C-22 sterol desaturase [Starmerella bacillaris]